MITLGSIDYQIVSLLVMLREKHIASEKTSVLLDKLTPGLPREIGDALTGRTSLDLAMPDVEKYVRKVVQDFRTGEEKKRRKPLNKSRKYAR